MKKLISKFGLVWHWGVGLNSSKRFQILLLILVLLTVLTVQRMLFQERMLRNASAVSTIGNVGVYWNPYCTESVTSIDWGTLSPGETKNIAVYVRNEDITMVTLEISAINWNPGNAASFLVFSWVSANAKINPMQVVKVTLKLYVKPNIAGITVFSFDIALNALQSTTIFEECFESGDLSGWYGFAVSSGGYAEVSDSIKFQGSYSARFETNAIDYGMRRAYIYKNIFECTTVYARAFFYIAEGLPLTDADDRFTLIQFLARDGSIISSLQIRKVEGESRFALSAFNNLQTATGTYPKAKVWCSVELFTKIHSTEGSVKAYINGVEHLAINNINTASLGNIATIRFGLVNSINVQNRVIVYFDCIAISTEYIGPRACKVDLGGGFPPTFFAFDGILDNKDMVLFLQCYRGTAPPEAMVLADLGGGSPPVLFAFDGIVDSKDLSLLLLCFKELGDG